MLMQRTPLFFLLLFFSTLSHSVLIKYDLTDLGANQFRYTYTIENNGSLPASANIQLFDIDFDTSLYSEASLSITSASGLAADWDQTFIASGPSVPALFDVFALTGGLASGNTVSGFSVDFIWLGSASGPTSQTFSVLDGNTFSIIETGLTLLNDTVTIPTPTTLLLLCITTLIALRRARPVRQTG